MFYDLNIPWTSNRVELQRTLAFLAELDYNVVALNHTIAGKLPSDLTSPIPSTLPFSPSPKLHLLSRCTLILTDPSQNHRLTVLSTHYDIVALRPTTERALVQACQSLDSDLISLDLSVRFPFHFKHKTVSPALQRGIKFEICYALGVLANDGGMARRNLIGNATELIRATRGKGIVISSEAKRALACRGPWDVINLAAVWGLGQERGREAVGRESRSVVVQAEMKRRSFRGVIDVVYGGERPKSNPTDPKKEKATTGVAKEKRKAGVMDDGASGQADNLKPVSKREQKRKAKIARLESHSVEIIPKVSQLADKQASDTANQIVGATASTEQVQEVAPQRAQDSEANQEKHSDASRTAEKTPDIMEDRGIGCDEGKTLVSKCERIQQTKNTELGVSKRAEPGHEQDTFLNTPLEASKPPDEDLQAKLPAQNTATSEQASTEKNKVNGKRKADSLEHGPEGQQRDGTSLSKSAQKRHAKKMRLEAAKSRKGQDQSKDVLAVHLENT